MKNYKFLVPIVLVVFFVLSVYVLNKDKLQIEGQYNQYIIEARNCRKQGVLVDAETNYQKALSLNESVDLYIEIGEFYKEAGKIDNAEDWGYTILKKYPKNKEGYEFLLDIYMKQENYALCFGMQKDAKNKGVVSDYIDSEMAKIEYKYFFSGEYLNVGDYSGGYCAVETSENWGYADTSGKKVISSMFNKAGAFFSGLAPIVDSDNNAYFIDTEGNKKFVVLNVDNVKELSLIADDIFALYNGSNWGFYNKNNECICSGFDEASSMGNGIAAVKKEGSWTLINKTGKKIIDKSYDDVLSDGKGVIYRNSRLFVKTGSDYYLIDNTGKVISDKKFQDAKIFNDETLAAVKINDKWGFIDKDGNIKIEPQYDDARSFSNGVAAVKMNGKWGFINADNNLIINYEFYDAKDFNNKGSVFIQQEDGLWQLLRLYKYNFS